MKYQLFGMLLILPSMMLIFSTYKDLNNAERKPGNYGQEFASANFFGVSIFFGIFIFFGLMLLIKNEVAVSLVKIIFRMFISN
jgi:hypothetical protein